MACREFDSDLRETYVTNSLLLSRQYLQYFGIDGQDAGGGVGTTTAIIFGIVCHSSYPTICVIDPVRQYAIGIVESLRDSLASMTSCRQYCCSSCCRANH